MNLPLWTLIFILPLAAAPIIYVLGRLLKKHGGHRGNPIQWLTLLVLIASGVILAQFTGTTEALTYQYEGILLSLDGIGLLLAAVVLVLTALVTLYSGPYLSGEEGQEKYYALLSIMAGAMIGLGTSTDLFNLYIWFEAMAISSYFLVAFYRKQPASLEAGVKYLVQSATGSVMVLFGIALVFSQTGTLSLNEIRVMQPSGLPILAAGALFVVGFGVKAALVPLHTWLPDAHSMAPSGISAMLSGVVIETGLVALLRSLSALTIYSGKWGAILLGLGALNMLIGNFLALRQTQVKRLLAFSSLAHIGYMLIGFGTAFAFAQPDAAQGAFFHLSTHALMKGLAFLTAGAFLFSFYLNRHEDKPLMISDLNGAASRFPLAAFGLSVAVLALGGLPPLAGFMSKWQIFFGAASANNPWVIALVIFAALNSLLSLAYYAPLVNAMYRHEPSEAVTKATAMPYQMAIPVVLLILAVLLLGLWPSLANIFTLPAGSTLMSLFGG
jgi:proton-translocating NADH-quinone oxidoreductase chain N